MPNSPIDPPPSPAAGALEAAGDAAYAWNLDSDRLDWAGRLEAVGEALATDCATGRAFAGRIHPDDSLRRQHLLTQHLDAAAPFDCEYRLRLTDGSFAWLHERGQVERAADGRPRRMLGVIRMVDDPKARQSRLEQRVSYDELTGHFNATRLREAVDGIIAAGQRRKQAAAFLSIGVDRLATITGKFGAAVADAVLAEIGRRLDGCLRVSDRIGRLAGDRFGVVLSHCAGEHVAAAARKVLSRVNSGPVMTFAGPVAATVSVGSISFPEQGATSYEIITRAESALAEAQCEDRGGYVHYAGTAAQRECRRGQTIAMTVQHAVRDRRLMFAFQPVVSAATGAVDYYECLLHLRGEDGGVMGAGEFVPAVEQQGLIRLVDRYVLDRAVEELAAAPDVALGFNISALTAADRAWLRALTGHLQRDPALARRLVIEITETAALYDIEESARFVAALREAGCLVALDDFGAGHTSLRYLHSLSVDTVKIDGGLIRNLSGSVENQAFLRHLLGLAGGFGFATVAECVESEADAEFLRREGVGFLQGHHCGRPSFERPWLAGSLNRSL